MAAVQGFVLMFQVGLLVLAIALKMGLTPPSHGVHEATPLPSAPSSSATHALL